VLERLPFQQFHGDERSPIDVIYFIDGADVRVVQRGCRFGFPLEAAERLRIVREIVGKKLESNMAAELQVFCFIDHTHPTPADLAKDAVVGDGLTYGIGRSSHWREWYGEEGRRSI